MLEKIGLPPKPSAKGSSWVLDASHCQSCSQPFSLFNRKHHCRRCGGLFCGTCSQARVVLRGQGDGAVRICEPCRKLEEAARFQSRYGTKGKPSKGPSTFSSDYNFDLDGNLAIVQGNDADGTLDEETCDSKGKRSSATLSDGRTDEDISISSPKMDTPVEQILENSLSPETLRQQALEQKQVYTCLKKEGKGVEALKAFKRSKELSREADALELTIKKKLRKAANELLLDQKSSKEVFENAKDKRQVSADEKLGQTRARKPGTGGEDAELINALMELGWTDGDLRDKKSKPGPASDLELLAEISDSTSKANGSEKQIKGGGANKANPTQMDILAHKRRALALKREGNMVEAKEELKKAKLLEQKLQELELYGGEDEQEGDDDDELTVLMRSLEKGEKLTGTDLSLSETLSDFSLPSMTLLDDDDDLQTDVTDDDLRDPSMAAALRAMGWEEEAAAMERFSAPETGHPEALQIDDSLSKESTIQSQILAHKRKALALKREGKIAEAKVELQESKGLEQNLEVMRQKSQNLKAASTQGKASNRSPGEMNLNDLLVEKDSAVDVSEDDMKDPEFIAALKAMGFAEEDPVALQTLVNPTLEEKRGLKEEIIAVKWSTSALNRKGQRSDTGDALLRGRETIPVKRQAASLSSFRKQNSGLHGAVPSLHPELLYAVDDDNDEPEVGVGVEEFMDPDLVAALKSVGWQEEDAYVQDEVPGKAENSPIGSLIQAEEPVTLREFSKRENEKKLELQRELLGHKRRALVLKRDGKIDEAKEELKHAKQLEKQMEELESSRVLKGTTKHSRTLMQQPLPSQLGDNYEQDEDVTEEDMQDPDLLNTLKNLGWTEEEVSSSQHKQSHKSISATSSAASHLPGSLQIPYGSEATHGTVADRLPESSGMSEKFAKRISEQPPYMKEALESRPSSLNQSKKEKNNNPMSAVFRKKEKEKHQGDVVHKQYTSPMFGNTVTRSSDEGTPNRLQEMVPDLLTGETWNPLVGKNPFQEQSQSQNHSFVLDSLGQGSHSTEGSTARSQQSLGAIGNTECNVTQIVSGVEQIYGDNILATDIEGELRGSKKREAGIDSIQRSSKIEMQKSTKLAVEDLHSLESIVTQQPITSSQIHATPIQQQILIHKRKALALKQEGKQVEAREELRQAKLLEKQLGVGTSEITEEGKQAGESKSKVQHALSNKVSDFRVIAPVTEPADKEQFSVAGAANKGAVPTRDSKVVSSVSHKEAVHQHYRQGKDRMKLQQESLAHKRRAMTLRREGKTEEAEAEFELAKSLEKRIEEIDGGDHAQSSATSSIQNDVGLVEELFDPQLMAALKGLGWKDGDILGAGHVRDGSGKGQSVSSSGGKQTAAGFGVSSSTMQDERRQFGKKPIEDKLELLSQPAKTAGRSKSERGSGGAVALTKIQEEKQQLEEQIKKEKIKALNLKRSGKNAEALDVLRGAKRLEKQLQSMG